MVERIAEPSRQVLDKKLSLLGITGYVGDIFTGGTVCGYLKEVRRKKAMERDIRPKVMEVVHSELCSLSWGDKCFRDHVIKMFQGADLSQIVIFYEKYTGAGKRKTTYFLNFITYDL